MFLCRILFQFWKKFWLFRWLWQETCISFHGSLRRLSPAAPGHWFRGPVGTHHWLASSLFSHHHHHPPVVLSCPLLLRKSRNARRSYPRQSMYRAGPTSTRMWLSCAVSSAISPRARASATWSAGFGPATGRCSKPTASTGPGRCGIYEMSGKCGLSLHWLMAFSSSVCGLRLERRETTFQIFILQSFPFFILVHHLIAETE